MYAKLVFRNAKRSVKDYLVYIVTMTICVTLFYAFLSISSSYYSPDIGSEYDFTLLSDGMKIAICMITLLLLFLIRFVNHYMLRRKQKEFAVQSIMGMEQKTIGRIFFAETLIMGMFSILIGIFCGVFCSQFIASQIPTTADDDTESSNDAYINGLLLLFCKNLEMKVTQLSVEEKQTLKEIFSRSKPAKEHRKLRRRNPKL